MGGGGGCAPRGYFGFQVTGMIKWGQKSKPKKILRASNKTPQNPGPNINPQKYHAEFPSLKNFQNLLNDITRKIKTLEIECLFTLF